MDFDFDSMHKEAIELLQKLIKNKCVNEETKQSGHEMRNVNTLIEYFEKFGIKDYEVFEPAEGRGNLLLRIRGSDNNAKSLMYESHIDVVPVNKDSWDVDPFSGEIRDGFIWGRGAIDMLYFTATQAVAFAHLHNNGFAPRGDLVFLAVADEEAGGDWGASWLIENQREKIYADYMIGEFGGASIETPGGNKIGFMTAEKGPCWFTMTISGEPGHASMPYGTNNAIVSLGKILEKIDKKPPKVKFVQSWFDFIDGLQLPKVLRFMLTHKFSLAMALKLVDKRDPGMAKAFHGLTRMTITPTRVEGGTKSNVIPDRVRQTFDVRLLPGQSEESVHEYLKYALGGELYRSIIIEMGQTSSGSSDAWQTELLSSVKRVTADIIPDVEVVPLFLPAVTDARLFRKMGIRCYGYSILGDQISLKQLTNLAHGDNERVPVEALDKSTRFFTQLAIDFLS